MKPLQVEVRDVLFVPGQPRIRKIFQRNEKGKITGFADRRESWDLVWKSEQRRQNFATVCVGEDVNRMEDFFFADLHLSQWWNYTGLAPASTLLTPESGPLAGSETVDFKHSSAASDMRWDSCCFVVSQLLNVAFSRATSFRLRLMRAM